MLCTTGASIPLNLDVIPCCKLHCIQQLCQANSESLALIWEKAVRQEEERIFDNVLRQIVPLKEWGWESCLTSKVCCVDEESQDAPIDVDQVYKRSEQPTNTKISIQPQESPACIQRRPNNGVQRTKEPTNPQSRSSSSIGFHNAWTPGTRSLVDSRNDSWCGSKPRLRYPRTIRYFEAQLGGNLLTLIGFKGEIWVCLSQLIKLTRLPSMLAKKRLEISDVGSDFISVSQRAYPDLFNDLHDLHLTTHEGNPILVLLSDAPTLMRAIDPLSSYQDIFENLAKEVAPLLDELIQ
uniref:Metabotropic glutamate receptor-like protein N n=3 Tax=Lygus hesperus TaxID=30085 RepID=A0A0A9WNI2_LYGHE